MYCENCGSKISDNAKFCMSCGHKISNIKNKNYKENTISENTWNLLEKNLDKALDDEKNKYLIYVLVAEDELKKGNYARAITALSQSIEIKPNFPALNMLGEILTDLKEYEKAIDYLNISLKLNPNYAQTWLDKGNALFWKGDFQSALKCLNNAINLDPDECDDALALKGMTLIKLGKRDYAMKILLRSLEMNPNNRFAKETLEYMYGKQYPKLNLSNKDESSEINEEVTINPHQLRTAFVDKSKYNVCNNCNMKILKKYQTCPYCGSKDIK